MKRKPPLTARLKRAWESLLGEGGGEFQGADYSRLYFDWAVSCISPDEEIRKSIRLMRARGRDLARNNGHAKHFLSQVDVGVLGPHGMKLQCQYRDENGELVPEVNDLVEARFAAWARQPVTTDRRLNLLEASRVHLKTVAREGEILVRKVLGYPNDFQFALESIDADMLDEQYVVARGTRTPEIRMGVEVDEWGAPAGYWLWDVPYGESMMPRKRYRVGAEEMIHPYISDRVNQTRGVTWFHAAITALRMLHGYQEAELINARVAAAKVAVIETTIEAAPPPTNPTTPSDGSSANRPNVMDAAPGTVLRLAPGETLGSWDPQHPNTAYGDFQKAILRELANSLEVSYPSFANDPEGVTFSSMRSFLLLERDVWRKLQQWWIAVYQQPIFEAWLQAAILSRALVLPAGYSADWRLYRDVRWMPRGYDWVDPLKDVQAEVLAIQHGLTSRQRVTGKRGDEFDDIAEELKKEKETAKKADISIDGPAPEIAPDDDDGGEAPAKKNGNARKPASRVLAHLNSR